MTGYFLCRHFREQRRALPQPTAVDDVGSKTFMVTGSNVGLGFEASVHLAKMAPKLLIVTSRDSAKCEQTRESILERVALSGVAPSPQISGWPLELDSFQDVCSFVDKFTAEEHQTLDALVANAGVLCTDYSQTRDGWETMLQVNYLSNALLSILFLPSLIKSSSANSPSRLVLVSSFMHYFSKEVKQASSWSNILDTINRPEFTNSGMSRYCISKLLLVVFVRELASRLPEPTSVVACAIDPGYCESKILRNRRDKWIVPIVNKILLARSTEEGSRTLVHAAVVSDRSMHGRYMASCQVTTENDFLFTTEGKAFSTGVWHETIMLLSNVDDRVSDIVTKYLRVDDEQ